jgi:hypothetical protein
MELVSGPDPWNPDSEREGYGIGNLLPLAREDHQVRHLDTDQGYQCDIGFTKGIGVYDSETQMRIFAFLYTACYLSIVAGITRFRPGISTQAQRGWFISWAIVGSSTGFVLKELSESNDSVSTHSVASVAVIPIIISLMYGVPTIGGIVAMIRQYLHLFEC